AFVRLRVGDNSGEPVYRVCQIIDVTEYKRPYSVQTVRTNKSFLLKHGSAEKVFLADIFSNTPFTQAEFDRWRLTCESESIPLPTKADAQHKAKDIAQAEAHIFTDEEISLMVKKKMQLPGAVPRNFAAEKSVLIKKLHLAKANGDRAAIDDISNQLREIDAIVEAKVFGGDDGNSTAAFARRREGGDTMLASAMGGKNIFKNPGLLERKRPAAGPGVSQVGTDSGARLGTLADIPGLSFAPAGPPLPDLVAAAEDDDDDGDGGVLDLYKSAPKLDLDL
ncbi:hypothetical protein BCR44DRAFT_51325, partial [Catenaria anguillulae PL171]